MRATRTLCSMGLDRLILSLDQYIHLVISQMPVAWSEHIHARDQLPNARHPQHGCRDCHHVVQPSRTPR